VSDCEKCNGLGVTATASVTPDGGAKLSMGVCGCRLMGRHEFDAITDVLGRAFVAEWNRRVPEVQRRLEDVMVNGSGVGIPRGLLR
jgi:hypothetical protein